MDKKELIKKLIAQKIPKKIINAFNKIRREDFVLKESKEQAYEDIALSIGFGQTISQPYTIGFMLSLLEIKDNQKILEIGSGSGYVLALLNELSKNSILIGVERIKELAERSKKILKDFLNIKIIKGNGLKVLDKNEKFDRIIVSASAENIPENFVSQLKDKGVLVIPVKNSMVKIKKNKDQINVEKFGSFVFVPLIDDS